MTFSLLKSLIAAAVLSFTFSAHSASNAPAIPSQNMTCGEAIQFYQKYRRIYTLVHGNVLPIYGFTPAQEWRTLHCNGRGKSPKPRLIETSDKRHCAIGVICM